MPTEFEQLSEQQSYEKIMRLLQLSAHGIHDILLSLPESLQKQVMAAAIAVTQFMQKVAATSHMHAALQALHEQAARSLKELQKKIADLELTAANDPERQRELRKLNALYQKTSQNLAQIDESLAQLNIKLGALNQEIAQVQFNIQQTVQSFIQSVTHFKQQTQQRINANVDQTLQANPTAMPIMLRALPQQSEQQIKQTIAAVATAVAYQRAQAPSPEQIQKIVRPQAETDDFTQEHKRRSIMFNEIVAYNFITQQASPINAPKNKQAKTEMVRVGATTGGDSIAAVTEEQQKTSTAIKAFQAKVNSSYLQLEICSAKLNEIDNALAKLYQEKQQQDQKVSQKSASSKDFAAPAKTNKLNGKTTHKTAKSATARQNLTDAKALAQASEELLQTMYSFFKIERQANSATHELASATHAAQFSHHSGKTRS